MKTVVYLTCTKLPCIDVSEAPVVLCLIDGISLSGRDDIPATLSASEEVFDDCNHTSYWRYTFSYDETILANPEVLLKPDDIVGAFCETCFTTWIKELIIDAAFGTIDFSFIPDLDDAYNLGSTAKRWRNLYLGSSGGIHVNDGDQLFLGIGTGQYASYNKSSFGDLQFRATAGAGSAFVLALGDFGNAKQLIISGGTADYTTGWSSSTGAYAIFNGTSINNGSFFIGTSDSNASASGEIRTQSALTLGSILGSTFIRIANLQTLTFVNAFTNATVLDLKSNGQLKSVTANEGTGSGSAGLGGNCPAVTLTAPNTWLKWTKSDGSQLYIPAWK